MSSRPKVCPFFMPLLFSSPLTFPPFPSRHSFLRRKRDADCYSNVAFETEINATICECERDDYVCDYCFELEAETETCVKSELGECSDYDPYAPPEDCEEYFQVPTGYRKVRRGAWGDEGGKGWLFEIVASVWREIIIEER